MINIVSQKICAEYTFHLHKMEAVLWKITAVQLNRRKDTIIAFFFGANKNKDNAKVALTSSNS